MANTPANFAALYEGHSQFSWDENLARIVEATTAISPTGIHFAPTATDHRPVKILFNKPPPRSQTTAPRKTGIQK